MRYFYGQVSGYQRGGADLPVPDGLLLCLMVWVITRLLRFLFPQRFRSQAPTKKKKKKPSPAVTEEDEE